MGSTTDEQPMTGSLNLLLRRGIGPEMFGKLSLHSTQVQHSNEKYDKEAISDTTCTKYQKSGYNTQAHRIYIYQFKKTKQAWNGVKTPLLNPQGVKYI